MRAMLLLPALFFFSVPVVRCIFGAACARAEEKRAAAARAAAARAAEAEREAMRREREAANERRRIERERKQAERERRQAEKLEAARLLAEYKERAAIAQAKIDGKARGDACTPSAKSEDAQPLQPVTSSPVTSSPAAPSPVLSPEAFAARFAAQGGPAPAQDAPAKSAPVQTFAGKRVAFTGKLPGMTRADAIRAVQARGGAAFAHMPISTNLLVVGEKPGENKLNKADEWIAHVKKITAEQFMSMLAA